VADPPDPRERAETEPPGGADPERHSSKLPDSHWSRSREGKNDEAMQYLRERSKAPGVAEGGSARNHYCLECNGVIPLNYDRRQAAKERPPEQCPHCGAPLEQRVRAMFNWVETDEVPASDIMALLPVVLGLLLVVALTVWAIFAFLI